jgi:primary-amine oxidase
VSFHLVPAAGPVLLAQRDSPVARRGLFTTRSLWVTPHVDGQVYPAGQYVFQSRRDTGLAEWTQEVRALGGGVGVL